VSKVGVSLGALDDKRDPRLHRKFKLGHLGNLDQVIVALGKTIRAMADGTPDSQAGGRICNRLGSWCFP
jgi:hypothetical protein